MIEIDKISHLVTTDTDIKMVELEKQLAREGFTLNYYTPPRNKALLVEVLEERLPNLFGHAFGGIEELCVQVLLARPDGKLFTQVAAPRSATGPSLKKMAIGAGDRLGLPIQATLKIFPEPPCRRVACAIFPDKRHRELFVRGVEKLRMRLPLRSLLAPAVRGEFFENLSPKQEVEALAFWGEVALVEVQEQLLREEAEKKRGQWVEVEKGGSGEKLFQALLVAQAHQVREGPLQASGLPASQMRLSERILRIS